MGYIDRIVCFYPTYIRNTAGSYSKENIFGQPAWDPWVHGPLHGGSYAPDCCVYRAYFVVFNIMFYAFNILCKVITL